MPQPRAATTLFVLLICLLAICMSGCSGRVTVNNDDRTIDEVISKAEELVYSKAYAEAAHQYAIAILKEPSVGQLYLRRAELLERIDKDKEAYQVYKDAMDNVPEDDPGHLKIMHRLALIDANHLFKIEEAEELLERMPDKSIEKYDTAAFLYYQASQYEQSIKLLNKALERVRTADMKALLLYHAALVYVKLEDEKNLFGSLYFSINNAEHLGLIRDIEQLWQEINQEPKEDGSIFPKP